MSQSNHRMTSGDFFRALQQRPKQPLNPRTALVNSTGETGESRRPYHRLSFAQQRMWFLDQLAPENRAYTITMGIRFEGALNRSHLELSLSHVVQRHESLRTIYWVHDGEPVQEVRPFSTFHLQFEDVGEAQGGEEAVAHIVEREAMRPFDLSEGPIIRALLIRRSSNHHILVVNVHHIAFDGWSTNLFWHELAELYNSQCAGTDSSLAEMTAQYSDFAEWDRAEEDHDSRRQQLSYWMDQLRGVTPLDLSHGQPPEVVPTHAGVTISTPIPPAIARRVRDCCQRENVTTFMVVQAATAIALSRYAGVNDVAVGSPIINRPKSEFNSVIGLFTNTIVFRISLEGNPTVSEFLSRVRDVCIAGYENRDVPFERLLQAVHPERDSRRNPLFQVMLAMNTAVETKIQLSGLKATKLHVDSKFAKFDLLINVVEGPGEDLEATWQYAVDSIAPGMLSSLTTYWIEALNAITGEPTLLLSELASLPHSDLVSLTQWNRTSVDYKRLGCVHEMVARQTRTSPEAVAIVSGHREITYRELDQLAAGAASVLQRHSVDRGSVVGVVAERSVEVVVAMLGILRSGAAYLPMSRQPASRLKHMVDTVRPKLVLVDDEETAGIDGAEANVLPLSALMNANPEAHFNVQVDEDDLVTVIFTSGSTGLPKAVMSTHRGLANQLAWSRDSLGMEVSDRVLQKTSLTFDVSVWEMLLPLVSGGRLVIAAPNEHRDGHALVERVVADRITVIHFVPSMLTAFLDEPDVGRCTSLRLVVASGEAVTPTHAVHFQDRFLCRFVNLYGPTEAAVHVSNHNVTSSDRQSVPIGTPVSNTSLYVLDGNSALAPIGVPGELHIGGLQLARGYFGSPSLTAERFIPDPFGASGQRLYRTGDQVRLRTDGKLEFLGRLDSQIKIRGYRVELGEIEQTLRSSGLVRDVIVTPREFRDHSTRLVAYVVPSASECNPESLREHAKRRLPDYMLPAAIVVIGQLPLSANGKVDRSALPLPQLGSDFGLDRPTSLCGKTEEKLAAIWASLLEVPTPGRDEDFFAIGGDSIVATRMTAKIRSILGVSIPVSRVFEKPTIAGLARAVDAVSSSCSVEPPLSRRQSTAGESDLQAALDAIESMPEEAAGPKLED